MEEEKSPFLERKPSGKEEKSPLGKPSGKEEKIEKKEKGEKDTGIDYSFVKIMTGSDLSSRKLPLMSIKSVNPGPVVWLTACIHGDEVGGMVIIQEIFKKIKNSLLKGSIYAFPLLNPIGFEAGLRNIVFSKEDLNRSFPGNKDGSLAERIADKIFSNIKDTHPSVVLDLHNEWRLSFPHILLDPSSLKNKAAYKKSKKYAQKIGLLIVGEDIELMKKEEEQRSLSYSLIDHNIPALTLELGEDRVVNEENVSLGVSSIWNLLAYLGMVEPITKQPQYAISKKLRKRVLKYSQEPLSSTSGIIRFLVSPGDFVTKGQPFAKIYNAFGRLEETLTAKNDGIVLGSYSSYLVSFPGVPIMSFGVLK